MHWSYLLTLLTEQLQPETVQFGAPQELPALHNYMFLKNDVLLGCLLANEIHHESKTMLVLLEGVFLPLSTVAKCFPMLLFVVLN